MLIPCAIVNDLFAGRDAARIDRIFTGTWWFVINASPDPREVGVL